MKLVLIKAALAASVLTISGFANAGLIDFSSMADGVYSGNSDFTVTTYGGPESDASLIPLIRGGFLCNSTDVIDPSCTVYPTESIIDFDFNIGLDSIILSMFWAGDPDNASISSFDISGNILESFGYLAGENAMYTFNSADDIYSIQTNSGMSESNNWWYQINSIDYTPADVPAPSTLAILALGLIGLGSRRFKK
jgi:hypothetical protein